jgi:nonsense-mediated mRNA decay protein 3
VSGEFCVVCGRTDLPLVDAVCADCFVQSHALLTAVESPTVVICPTCGARRVGAHWERSGASELMGAEDLAPMVAVHPEAGVRRIEWTETGLNPMLRELEGVAQVRFRGTERTLPVHLTVKIEHRTCEECSRRTGRYYTAIIQLRGPEGRNRLPPRELRTILWEMFERVFKEARADWKKALSWKEELPEGWDFYVTDTLAARALARLLKSRLGAEFKESATLWGRKKGKDVYRVTLCLRVPLATTKPPADVESPGGAARPARGSPRLGSSRSA